jgi:soluble lytic murein transglycosylase
MTCHAMMNQYLLRTGKTGRIRIGNSAWLFGLAFIFVFAMVSSSPVQAAIYFFVDESGVPHFSNVPADSRYRLKKSAIVVPQQYSAENYDNHIHQAARHHQVDPLLIKAIVEVESDFDRYAVSKKGALGLMQLMPETAADMQVVDPFDPEDNILGGTRFLKKNLESFNNDLELSLAAYNAGPGRVRAVGRIPNIPETQVFIKKVLKSYRRYQNDSKYKTGARYRMY